MKNTAIALRDGCIVRRAKPLLGTLVDVAVGAPDRDFAQTAIGAAFAEIRDVHRLMSFHEPSSDVSRINRAAPGVPVEVDPRTADVLRLATELQDASAGGFDCTVAPVLVRHRLLPWVDGWDGNEARPRRRELHGELAGCSPDRVPAFAIDACSVVKQRDCLIDLGGIAKGYAVDRAVEAVRALAKAGGHRLTAYWSMLAGISAITGEARFGFVCGIHAIAHDSSARSGFRMARWPVHRRAGWTSARMRLPH
ncbi:hypothetical protein LMG28614_01750 [Paraburkholderia ultramafica]|uniref:FAD:protein FMN transferase n=1 Tax=Paraburkholderia ultramafica TaxID=1544867 RepID=A0A6S7CMY3_9BURK|nr:FAD:protein FMN transferase [Paraburkholderia ultramafica]CAB3783877.1 hypothetical protein LMG28614_01750 [Paraburkholderia ultramafica]